MKVYIKFISKIFFKSLFYVFSILISLVFLLNLLTELEFFKNIDVKIYFPIFLSLINSPSLIFEMFPFILLLTVQLFYIKLIEYKEIEIFKYSGLKNSKILIILGSLSLVTGILVSSLFYNFSSNLKSFYLDLKSDYTKDGKYLAVINKNGLWIKDKIENKILITSSSLVNQNLLIDNFITEFDEKFNVIRNIQSKKINITNNQWIIYDAKVYQNNTYENLKNIKITTNFNSERIQTLYSNLSALSIIELYELRKNYKKLNYSLIDLELHILKILTYPLFLLLISLFSSLLMLNIKDVNGTTLKISIGLFLSVIIYYLNNFSFVLGGTERIPIFISLFSPILVLAMINLIMLYKVNEK